jgi:hypothetical protein
MIKGQIAFKTPWPGALFPENPSDSQMERLRKIFIKDKSAIPFSHADEGRYCRACKKIFANLNANR